MKVRKLAHFTTPTLPFKRKLTLKEEKKILANSNFQSWTRIDAEGRIFLGPNVNGTSVNYITEKDLKELELPKY